MEPENTTLEKEKHLQTTQFLGGSMLSLGGCMRPGHISQWHLSIHLAPGGRRCGRYIV